MRLQLIAALSLLGGATYARRPSVQAAVDLSLYTDTDHVGVASPGVAATVADELAGWSVSGRYMLDAVSAASVDIVSTASSRWTEQRHVGSLLASYKRGAVGVTASGGVSSEPDYLSVGAGATGTLELLDKNLTPYLGFSYGHDDVGRTGLDRARWELMQKGGLQAGATFVVNRFIVASLQLDTVFERGYLAKPYRYIPLFAPGFGAQVPAGASPAEVSSLRLDERPIDRLPRARDRYALTGRIAGRVGRSSLRLDERLYTDSWAMFATTTDARVLVDATPRLVVWPHLRFHWQSAVSFWQRAYEAVPLPDGTIGLPPFRTGDRELSTLSTVTFGAGLKGRLTHNPRSPWFVTVEAAGAYTHYPDALYITGRWSVYSTVTLSAEWN
jgi:hypothetical protein